MNLEDKNILLIITGGIAAYKALELIRLLKKQGASIRSILTKGGSEFITPLSVSSLSGEEVYTELFSLKDETEMGHIRLSREADLILVVPATANIIAKMAHGIADDLASTTLLATDTPAMVAPAMNPMMWQNPATQDNIKTLKSRGIKFIEPKCGEVACGETGKGRLAELDEVMDTVKDFFFSNAPLKGKTAIVTSGPTYEPIDPVRFIGNHSSGKQGIAIAKILASAGAKTILVTGPTHEDIPAGIKILRVTTAQEMLEACENNLPADIAICAAAVSDWKPDESKKQKMKKQDNVNTHSINLVKNPDILYSIANAGNKRPELVIGFSAETEKLIEYATDKIKRKNCDWIIANDVSPETGTFGGDMNTVHLIKLQKDGTTDVNSWPQITKDSVAHKLVEDIIERTEQ